MRNYLHRLSGDRHLAEDLVQETFYRALRQYAAGARVTYVSAWLFRIARNLYLDWVKKRRLPETSLEGLGPQAVDQLMDRAAAPGVGGPTGQPEVEALRREEGEDVAAALRRLPEAQRTALILRDIEGLGYAEIAEVLTSNTGAVKSLLHRARAAFARVYTEDEDPGRESPCRPRTVGRNDLDA